MGTPARRIPSCPSPAPGSRSTPSTELILLAYRRGLRVSELVALRWDQIDLKIGRIHIHSPEMQLKSIFSPQGDRNGWLAGEKSGCCLTKPLPPSIATKDWEMKCLWCNNRFTPRCGGSPQRFCSAEHRSMFWSALRRWGERAVAAGILTVADPLSGPSSYRQGMMPALQRL